jgi:feruloyl esterase
MPFWKDKIRLTASATAGLALSLAFQPPAQAGAFTDKRCTALAGAALPGVQVLAADPVAPGRFVLPESVSNAELRARTASMPAFCRVQLRATPTADSRIGIEVWLPLKGWNGRYLGTGNGGGGGAIAYAMGMIEGLKRGFAVANTDLGTAPDIALLAEHPERWNDFGHRATHEMTKAAKYLVHNFYNVKSFHSYFAGCSTGGQQALVTAQRYPDDYDGILAGAPGNNRTHSSSYFLWNYQSVNATPESKLSPRQWSMVARSVLTACAGRDGGAPGDQFLTDPRICNFDPATMPQCEAGSNMDECLTSPQLAAVRRLYAGPVNPRTGERIYPGLTMGSEEQPLGPVRFSDASILTRLFVMQWGYGPTFSAKDFDFDHDLDAVDARLASALNANKSDLNDFAQRGGKLMLYTGLADPGVPFLDVVHYYDRVLATSVASRGRDFARLFLVPGMGHCMGGPGVTDIGQPFSGQVPPDRESDALMTLVAWTEGGAAPRQIVARKAAAGAAPAQERPLCAFPAFPEYRSGDPGKRSSFVCTVRSKDSGQAPAPRYLN